MTIKEDIKSFRQKCIEQNLDYNKVYCFMYQHKKTHTELTEEEYIELYKEKQNNKVESLASKCRKYNIKYETASAYKQIHPELTDDQIIEYYLKPKETSTVQKLKELGISVSTYHRKSKEYTNLTFDELIIKCKEASDKRKNSFAKLCRDKGLNVKNVTEYKRKHPELSIEQVIENCVDIKNNKRDRSLKQITIDENIDYNQFAWLRHKNKELTVDKIVEICKNTPKRKRQKYTGESLRSICIRYGVNYDNACSFRQKHPELTNEEIIVHYRPNYYINLLGEIVINDNNNQGGEI